MPCFFIHNLPKKVMDHTWFEFKLEEVKRLYKRVSMIAGCLPEELQFHLVNDEYRILEQDGRLYGHSVHIKVDWHAGRTPANKLAISRALFDFMKAHGLEKGLDITFRDSPVESFFLEKDGEVVSVSSPKPTFRYLHRHDQGG